MANGTKRGQGVSAQKLVERYYPELSVGFFYKGAREGRVPNLRFGRRVLFIPEEVEEYARRAAEQHAGGDL